MDIEPVKLDMNLFHTAIQMHQHAVNEAETIRHHGVMEQQGAQDNMLQQNTARRQSLIDVLKTPGAPPEQRYDAFRRLYGEIAPDAKQPAPLDYLADQGRWTRFITSAATDATSPETIAAHQDIVQNNPFAEQEAKAAMQRHLAAQQARGFQQAPEGSGAAPLSPDLAAAVQSSKEFQGERAKQVFPDAMKRIQAEAIQQRTQALQVKEQVATGQYNAFKAIVPLFNPEAEVAALAAAAVPRTSGPLSQRLSSKEMYDKAARQSGAYKTDELNQLKDAIPQQMDQLNEQGRMLREKLRQAQHDVSGTSGSIDQIRAELAANDVAVLLKGKEWAYAESRNPNDLQAMKQSYAAHAQNLKTMQDQIMGLRNEQVTSSQTLANQKYQDTKEYHDKLIPAQAAFAKTDLTAKAAGAIAEKYGVLTEDVLNAGKDPNKPQVQIDMADKTAGREFIQSTRTTYDQLKNAPAQLKNLAEAKALIPQAKGFMGPGGESMLEAAKFLNNRLGMSINTEGVKGAEELRSRIFFNVMDNLKKMDAQPSQMQQIIMMDSLGKLGTDPHALTHVLNAYEDSIRNKVEVHNTEVEGAMKQGTKFPYDPRIKLPPQSARETSSAKSTAPSVGHMDSGYVYKGGDPSKRENWEKVK